MNSNHPSPVSNHSIDFPNSRLILNKILARISFSPPGDRARGRPTPTQVNAKASQREKAYSGKFMRRRRDWKLVVGSKGSRPNLAAASMHAGRELQIPKLKAVQRNRGTTLAVLPVGYTQIIKGLLLVESTIKIAGPLQWAMILSAPN